MRVVKKLCLERLDVIRVEAIFASSAARCTGTWRQEHSWVAFYNEFAQAN
jgi:hypothetical protein